MSNAHNSAFPFTPTDRSGQVGPSEPGLTKREYFALHLMCALKSQVDHETGNDGYTHEGAAGAAVLCADDLLAKLSDG